MQLHLSNYTIYICGDTVIARGPKGWALLGDHAARGVLRDIKEAVPYDVERWVRGAKFEPDAGETLSTHRVGNDS